MLAPVVGWVKAVFHRKAANSIKLYSLLLNNALPLLHPNATKASLDRLIKKTEISGYDECYPGFAESYDAMGDSDDETDFSKMDMGNKKGPVGRWDFETQEEYGDYMSNLEAMPRAAYQYGVKKPEGRKTRSRLGGGGQQNRKDDKAAVDRQLQQITSMINKRKQAAASEEEGGKRAKY